MRPDLVVPIAGMATGTVLLAPVVRVVVCVAERRLLPSPGASDGDDLREELERVTECVLGAGELTQQVAELEERMDFAERMLVRPEDPALAGKG